MKRKAFALTVLTVLCLFLVSCGDGGKSPVDQPDAKWSCEYAGFEFKVTDGKVTDAVILDEKGEKMSIDVAFSDSGDNIMTVTDAQSGEKLFEGVCEFKGNKFTVNVNEYYDESFMHVPVVMAFNRFDV